MGLFKALFSSQHRESAFVEHWIEKLAQREDKCEYLRETNFTAAAQTMTDRRAQVLDAGQPFPEESRLYRLALSGRSYDVRVSRSADRRGILLTSEFSPDA
jgi:hypothetical protein